MTITKKKISTLDLKLGKYVSMLDRPWREADVLFQGFYVTTLEQIEDLRKKFQYVYVDTMRYNPPDKARRSDREDALDEELKNICGHLKRDNVYKDSTGVKEELVVAQEIHRQAMETVVEMMGRLQLGRGLKLVVIHNVVIDLMESILLN